MDHKLGGAGGVDKGRVMASVCAFGGGCMPTTVLEQQGGLEECDLEQQRCSACLRDC